MPSAPTPPPAPPVTRRRADELLAFLPLFGDPGPDTAPTWRGLDQDPGAGEIYLPYPVYPPAVTEFFRLANQPWWRDPAARWSDDGSAVGDDAAVAAASLAEVRAMLSYCVRGERFCDGFWEAVVQGGRVGALLRRLAELRGGLPGD